MKNKEKQIKEVKKEMETLKSDFDKNYLSLETKLKKLEKETYEVGDEVNWCGFDWIIIKKGEIYSRPITTLILKNKLSGEILDELKVKHDSYNDVVFNNDQTNNKWGESYIRRCLIDFAKRYLDFNKLIETRSYLDEDTGTYDCIRLLTLREAEALPDSIRNINDAYWTMTPCYNTTDTRDWSSVFGVFSDGYLYWNSVNNTFGVRPVITLLTEELN